MVLRRPDVPARAARQGPLPSVLPGRHRSLRRPGPYVDAEVIDMVVGFISSLGITEVEVLVNSIGGPETRENYREALLAYLDAVPRRALRRLPAPHGCEPASRARLQGSALRGDRSRGSLDPEAPDRRRPRALRWPSRDADQARHAVSRRRLTRARPRLLHPHAFRGARQGRRARRAERTARRRPVRPDGQEPRRPGHPGDRVRDGPRAPADGDARTRTSPTSTSSSSPRRRASAPRPPSSAASSAMRGFGSRATSGAARSRASCDAPTRSTRASP